MSLFVPIARWFSLFTLGLTGGGGIADDDTDGAVIPDAGSIVTQPWFIASLAVFFLLILLCIIVFVWRRHVQYKLAGSINKGNWPTSSHIVPLSQCTIWWISIISPLTYSVNTMHSPLQYDEVYFQQPVKHTDLYQEKLPNSLTTITFFKFSFGFH